MAPKRETALDAWGAELGLACEATGMTGRQLAEALHVAASTVSQWMNGKRTPHMKDVERCDKVLGTNGYLARYFERWVTRELPAEWVEAWRSAEARANLVHEFDLSVVPGLLQTPEYARAVLQYLQRAPINIEERVRRRIARQAILDDENPPMCIFVIDEYALRRKVGGKEVMVEQLARLVELAARPNIVIKVVPWGTEYYAASPFMVVRFDKMELANLDTALDGLIIEGEPKVTELAKIWEEIREAALSPKESLKLIEKAMEEWQ